MAWKNVRISNQWLMILGVIFGIVLAGALLTSFLLASKASQQLTQRQEVKDVAQVNSDRQVKKIIYEREGQDGLEYVEIFWDGTVNIYDKNWKLKKRGLQGFGRINSLFNNINNHWEELTQGKSGWCNLTIETNLGINKVNCQSSGGKDKTGIIDEIIDATEDTFAPTPTFAPTSTPATARPEPTATPEPTSNPPIISVTPGGTISPTPMPGYMTAPPFKCSDYPSDKPFIISNIICGAH